MGKLSIREGDFFLLEVLMGIRSINHPEHTPGVCSLVHRQCIANNRYPRDSFKNTLTRLFSLWPEFSGNTDYPIPGGRACYVLNYRGGSLWKGKQRVYRYNLLDFMIKQLESEL